MVILSLLMSHIVVGAVCFMVGGDRMKRKIEKELLKVLEEHKSQLSK